MCRHGARRQILTISALRLPDGTETVGSVATLSPYGSAPLALGTSRLCSSLSSASKLSSISLQRYAVARVDPARPTLLASVALLSHDPESDCPLDRSRASVHVGQSLLVGKQMASRRSPRALKAASRLACKRANRLRTFGLLRRRRASRIPSTGARHDFHNCGFTAAMLARVGRVCIGRRSQICPRLLDSRTKGGTARVGVAYDPSGYRSASREEWAGTQDAYLGQDLSGADRAPGHIRREPGRTSLPAGPSSAICQTGYLTAASGTVPSRSVCLAWAKQSPSPDTAAPRPLK